MKEPMSEHEQVIEYGKEQEQEIEHGKEQEQEIVAEVGAGAAALRQLRSAVTGRR